MRREDLIMRGHEFSSWINNYRFNPAEFISDAFNGMPIEPDDPMVASYREWYSDLLNYMISQEDYIEDDPIIRLIKNRRSISLENYKSLMALLEN